jgi:hypothetical protein
MSAERRRSAEADIAQYLPLLVRELFVSKDEVMEYALMPSLVP